jgi:hypothetical protein
MPGNSLLERGVESQNAAMGAVGGHRGIWDELFVGTELILFS